MRKLLELLGMGLLVIGGSSLVHHFTDWFGKWALVDRLPWFDGYELYASGIVAVLGFAVLCASDMVPGPAAAAAGLFEDRAVPMTDRSVTADEGPDGPG
ncbi:hypothetical protein [Streptomyces zagrosensis]|uniref:Uncharacterized protein n=1 Tax=Streptomyces zagrosensis TaxID=1042984 RepID=A0A7W9UZU0_9ACTN|nr:hypothetical protein [Streptomyces zagrosensis]MBB5936089.1 hypothetical protein [Streptomyces zagrosensis]